MPPLMLQTDANPGGLPSVLDDLQAQLGASGPLLLEPGLGPPMGATARSGSSEAIIANWWRQGTMGGAKAHYDGTVALPDRFHGGPQEVTVPALVMHGDDDQIVPHADSGPVRTPAARHGTLKTTRDSRRHADHQAATINADLLALIRSWARPPPPSQQAGLRLLRPAPSA